jgi:hypothetical protein
MAAPPVIWRRGLGRLRATRSGLVKIVPIRPRAGQRQRARSPRHSSAEIRR